MKVKFYGTRGSIPTPSCEGFQTTKFGGNTTCLFVETKSGDKLIFDGGTGIRVLGNELMGKGFAPGQGGVAHLFYTHTHWDHIQGTPFFVPGYIPTNNILVYGEAKVAGEIIEAVKGHSESQKLLTLSVNGDGIEKVLSKQQDFRNFPAPVGKGFKAFVDIIPAGKIYDKNGVVVEANYVNHPGGCVSYKVIEDGKSLVVCNDFEPDKNGLDDRLVDWWKNADLVLADSQYEIGSAINKFMDGYGHSDIFYNMDLAKRALVKHLVGWHHEPKMDDSYHSDLENRAKEKACTLRVSLAREGQVIEL